jgi:hypothetical protein
VRTKSIPDDYFVGKRFTRDDLRSALAKFNDEIRSPEMAEEVDAEPVMSEAEEARTAQYREVIERALTEGES